MRTSSLCLQSVGVLDLGLTYLMPIPRSSYVAALVLAAAAHAAFAPTAAAQVRPLPDARQPAATWVSASGALVDLQSFYGGANGEAWNWGSGVQLRGTIERALRRDMTVGLAGSIARLPLSVSGGTCASECTGDGTVWTAMGVLRLGGGGGIGFHSAFEASAGAAGFTNLPEQSAVFSPLDAGTGSTTRTAAHNSIVPVVAAAYGVGYTLNPGLEISLVQEIGIFIYGTADAAPSNGTSTPRFNATRLTLRYALGQ